MYADKLSNEGILYLGTLELSQLYQLQDELNDLWNKGQSIVSNNLYDKVVDGINYEMTQLTNDPYQFFIKKSDFELKRLFDYFTQQRNEGKASVDDTMLDIIQQELFLRNEIVVDSSIKYPSHWSDPSQNESSVKLTQLDRFSQEFRDISNYFIKSLGRSSTVIYSINRIENHRVWNLHQQIKRTIHCDSTRLIHGTSSLSSQKSITYHGFYRNFCPNGLIGDGIYFALNASYSNDDPYVLRVTPHRRELFICQVLLGKTTLGKNGLESPPEGFNAVHFSNTHEVDEFCIFNPYQAYPEYIVQYDYQ